MTNESVNMSDLLTMNKAQMSTLASTFETQSAVVTELMRLINQGLDTTEWQGARSRQFRQMWIEQFQPNLVLLRDSLAQNSTFLNAELANAVRVMDQLAAS